MGHRTRLRWNDEDAWVRSGPPHEPLINPEVFEPETIAERVGCSHPTVPLWRDRYAKTGLDGLKD